MSAQPEAAQAIPFAAGPKHAAGGDSRSLWAITSYFNPQGFDRRRQAYRQFRRALTVPLVTVELGYDGRFDLGPDDADVYLAVPGSDLLWQKERMLNLALQLLPPECEVVAWLDCDILFADADWPRHAQAALEQQALVQLFRHVHYLESGWAAGMAPQNCVSHSRASLASGISPTRSAQQCLVHPSPRQRPGTYNCGMAWAARRELLDRHRFFDASIIGGGDRAMASAAFGCFDHVAAWHQLNARQLEYYLQWAQPFYESCQGRVGALEADIYHQWHGDTANRGLGTRHTELGRHGFDPFKDIAIDGAGSWRWNSDKPALHDCLRRYFAARKEDG
jgi:hypothetical protein